MDDLSEKLAKLKTSLIGQDPAKPASQPTPTGPLTQAELARKIQDIREAPTRGDGKEIHTVQKEQTNKKPKQSARPKIVRRDIFGAEIQ